MVISRIIPSRYVETNQIWVEEFQFATVVLEQHSPILKLVHNHNS